MNTSVARTRPQVLLLSAEDNRDLLAHLERRGYGVTTVSNPSQALATLRGQRYDLVLLEAVMPEKTVVDLVEHCRAEVESRDVPIILLTTTADANTIATWIKVGVDDFLLKPFDPATVDGRIRGCLERKQRRARERRYFRRILSEAVALSTERDFHRMLERFLLEAQALCHADGGTLYWRSPDSHLHFVVMCNKSLGIRLGGSGGGDIPYPPVDLYDERTGEPNHHNVASHAALTEATISIPDAYAADGFDFSGTIAFDKRTGYRSTSFLAVPLKNAAAEVVGVMELINAQDPVTGVVVPFRPSLQPLVEAQSLLGVVLLESSIREQSLRQEIRELRIKVDQASKLRQVAEITETEYFHGLQQRARELRRRASASSELVPELDR